MTLALYLLTSSGLPDLGEDVHFVRVAAGDEEAGSSGGTGGAVEQYGCATTLVADYGDLEALQRDVSRWWLEIANARPVLELLTTEPSEMSVEQRESVGKLEAQSWSIRMPLIVYRTKHPGAQLAARKLAAEAALASN